MWAAVGSRHGLLEQGLEVRLRGLQSFMVSRLIDTGTHDNDGAPMTCGARLTFLERLNESVRAIATRAGEFGKIQIRDTVPILTFGNSPDFDQDSLAGR